MCHRGDIDLGGCLFGSVCSGENASCPDPRQENDGTLCNFGSNVCIGGACTGKNTTEPIHVLLREVLLDGVLSIVYTGHSRWPGIDHNVSCVCSG